MRKNVIHPSPQSGFTLIEIMVVVALISILVAVIGISMSRDADRLAKLEASRFQAVVNEVRDEAILSGQDYWLDVNHKAGAYGFSKARDGEVDDLDSLLRLRTLKAGVDLAWETFAVFDDEALADQQRVLISSLGEISPFSAVFIGDEHEYRILVNDDNQLERQDSERRDF